jgi:hypothetical protein
MNTHSFLKKYTCGSIYTTQMRPLPEVCTSNPLFSDKNYKPIIIHASR